MQLMIIQYRLSLNNIDEVHLTIRLKVNSAPEDAEPVLSNVNATLTSDVVIVSTEILCLAKMLNTFAKKPCACSILKLERVSKVLISA